MLYSFVGENREVVLEKARTLSKTLVSKRRDAEVFDVDGDFFNTDEFKEIVFGQGLFGKSYIVNLNNILESKDSKDIFLEYLEDIKNSPNIFILRAGKLTADVKKNIEKFSEKVVEVKTKSGGVKKEAFNIFSVTDKLGERDRRGLWLVFWKAIEGGHRAEDVFWKLSWQLKTMIIATETGSPSEADMKPYPYNKAKSYAKNFERPELNKKFNELNELYRDVRLGKQEFETGLESFILSI